MSRSDQEQPNGKRAIIILQNASVSRYKNQMQNSSDLMIPSPKRSTTEIKKSKDASKHYNLIHFGKMKIYTFDEYPHHKLHDIYMQVPAGGMTKIHYNNKIYDSYHGFRSPTGPAVQFNIF